MLYVNDAGKCYKTESWGELHEKEKKTVNSRISSVRTIPEYAYPQQ